MAALEQVLLTVPTGTAIWEALPAARGPFGCCCKCSRWWRLSRLPGTCLVASLDRPGASAGRKAEQELALLGCIAKEVVPGRIYFRACGRPELLQGATMLENVGVVVLRHQDDPIGSFLDFNGATQETCLQRIVAAVLSADWHLPLAIWSALTGRPPGPGFVPCFRARAKRSTKAGKQLVSSDAIAAAVGQALAERFGWDAELDMPELEVRVQLNQEELLVSLPALVQPLGGRGCYVAHAGLHPSVSWVLARTLDIHPGDIVLDPMCGRGLLLCEAALNWPAAAEFIGCDENMSQLIDAQSNAASARLGCRLQFFQANASLDGGLPFATASVHRLMTDLPFGKQFGSVGGNEALYPSALAEFARVMSPGGRAVLLTSQANRAIMYASLAQPNGLDSSSPTLHAAWQVEHRRSFRLFSKMDACIYVLKRTGAPAPSAGAAIDLAREVLGAFQNGVGERSRRQAGSLGGATGRFPWEDGTPWHEQWARARPALVPWHVKG